MRVAALREFYRAIAPRLADKRSHYALSKKPQQLLYGVNDTPPRSAIFFTAIQHVGLAAALLVFPLTLIQSAGISTAASTNMLGLAMLVLGVGTILQGLPKGPVGSGFLCPTAHTGIFLGPSLIALKVGGLPLVFGMTVFAGLLISGLSFALRRTRALLPPEIGGLVIFFVGTNVTVVASRFVIGNGADTSLGLSYWFVAAITLATTVGLNVWGKGQFKVFCAIIGMGVGYITAIFTGVLSVRSLESLAALPMVSIPSLTDVSWSMSAPMVLPFFIAALAVTVKAIGDITVCQKINDAAWVRPDLDSISRGVFSHGLTNVLSGLAGSIGLTTLTASIGLQAATGVASRAVGFAMGGILIGLAFLPSVGGFLVLMPRPVMGASLLFAACFILTTGIQTITSRMLDVRRTIVIGLAMASGATADIMSTYEAAIPTMLQPIVGSSLVLGTAVALLLNALFRLGQRRHLTLRIKPEDEATAAAIEQFFEEAGRQWGARRDIMLRASFGVNQAIEMIIENCEPKDPLLIDARFDEFNVDIQITYQGLELELSEHRPSNEEIVNTESGYRRLAGYMLRRNADRIQSHSKNGNVTLQFHFDH